MASKEVSLFLRYPGPSHTLQRLQHSFLECVVEYKVGSDTELHTRTPAELRSEYQLKGIATLVDDEIVVQFVPRHAGVHTVRIFADTRELCRPVAFMVTRNCEVESLPIDRPVKPTSTTPREQEWPDTDYPSRPESQPQQPSSYYEIPQPQRRFTSEPSILTQRPNPLQRASRISSTTTSRPPSASYDGGAFAEHFLPSEPDQSSFGHIYTMKKAGRYVYGTRRGITTPLDPRSAITADTLRMLHKDIDLQLASQLRGAKIKKRCSICSRKVKSTKSITLGEEDYCESCFRRQYILRSAIEHFMIPGIQECTVDVPVNKKGTKFVSARKTIPNVNLRGLEPAEVRGAQTEFRKFDMEDNGWISKAVLLPVMKACLTTTMTEKEVRILLSSQALRSMIQSFGINDREEIHEIEFLALLAFVARERQRLNTTRTPHGKFTRSDLEMAYAFQHQFETQKGPVNPLHGKPAQGVDIPRYQVHQQQMGQFMAKSATEPVLTNMSTPRSPQHAKGNASSLRQPHPYQNPLLYPGIHPSQFRSPGLPSVYHNAQPPYRHSAVVGISSGRELKSDGVLRDLPEDDQDESDLPPIPPGKDPSASKLTSHLHDRGPANVKQMMEELKLTGGSADGWMLY